MRARKFKGTAGGFLTGQLGLACDFLSGRNCCGVVWHLGGRENGRYPGGNLRGDSKFGVNYISLR